MSNHSNHSGKQAQPLGSPPPSPRETLGETLGVEPQNPRASFPLPSSSRKDATAGTHDVPQNSPTQSNSPIVPKHQARFSSFFRNNYKNSPARSTRQNKPELCHSFEWEAQDIGKAKALQANNTPQEREIFAAPGRLRSSQRRKEVSPDTDTQHPVAQGTRGVKNPRRRSTEGSSMSRNRPRGAQNRDNGLAANEEIDMWNGITRDLKKAQERNDKQRVLGLQIKALNEKIAREGSSKLPHLPIIPTGILKLYCRLLYVCQSLRSNDP
jgi:hypothetical protein